MRTIVEVVIGDGTAKPKLRKQGGLWSVIGDTEQCVAYSRGVWVRTWDPSKMNPVAGKGLLIGPTRKLTVG
jgi:hypothetical protein